MQDGQNPRPLHEKGTRSSSPHVRHKPCSKSPHTPKPASSSFTNSGSPWPPSSSRARNPGMWRRGMWRRTSTAASQSWVWRGT